MESAAGAESAKSYTDPRAHDLRARYHELFEADELPVPVESIAEDLLGLTVVEDEHLEYSGMLRPARWEIRVNGLDTQPRRRFTIAHELGHWVCQHLEGKTAPMFCRPVDISQAADRALEREANIFAAELLMPEEVVLARHETDTASTAAMFGVSELAMAWRLFSFGLGEDPAVVPAERTEQRNMNKRRMRRDTHASLPLTENGGENEG